MRMVLGFCLFLCVLRLRSFQWFEMFTIVHEIWGERKRKRESFLLGGSEDLEVGGRWNTPSLGWLLWLHLILGVSESLSSIPTTHTNTHARDVAWAQEPCWTDVFVSRWFTSTQQRTSLYAHQRQSLRRRKPCSTEHETRMTGDHFHKHLLTLLVSCAGRWLLTEF